MHKYIPKWGGGGVVGEGVGKKDSSQEKNLFHF